jgi:hypothetical protein
VVVEEDTVLGVFGPGLTCFENWSALRAGGDASSRRELQRRDSACMVVMGMGIKDESDVSDVETEGCNVFEDLGCSVGESSIEEDMPLWRGNQDHTQSSRSNEVGVPVNLEWRLCGIPSWAGGAEFPRIPGGHQRRREWRRSASGKREKEGAEAHRDHAR